MDWGEFFTFFLAHTSMSVEDIKNSSLPFLLAVRENLTQHICIKAGIPYNDPDSPADSVQSKDRVNTTQQPQRLINANREPTLEDMELLLGGFG